MTETRPPKRVSVDAELLVRLLDVAASCIKWRQSQTLMDAEAAQALLWRQLDALINMGDDGGGTVQERMRGLNAGELAELSRILDARDKGKMN